jgi:hypothetical protein
MVEIIEGSSRISSIMWRDRFSSSMLIVSTCVSLVYLFTSLDRSKIAFSKMLR